MLSQHGMYCAEPLRQYCVYRAEPLHQHCMYGAASGMAEAAHLLIRCIYRMSVKGSVLRGTQTVRAPGNCALISSSMLSAVTVPSLSSKRLNSMQSLNLSEKNSMSTLTAWPKRNCALSTVCSLNNVWAAILAVFRTIHTDKTFTSPCWSQAMTSIYLMLYRALKHIGVKTALFYIDVFSILVNNALLGLKAAT